MVAAQVRRLAGIGLLGAFLLLACGGSRPGSPPGVLPAVPTPTPVSTGPTLLAALGDVISRVRPVLLDPALETAGSVDLSLGGRLNENGSWVLGFAYSNLQRRQTVRYSSAGTLVYDPSTTALNPPLLVESGAILDSDRVARLALDADLQACINANPKRTGWHLSMYVYNRGDGAFNIVTLIDSTKEPIDSVFVSETTGTVLPLTPRCVTQ